jgi:excinuclease ABC subunit C
MDEKSHLKERIARLPDAPGVYRFFNQEGEIIYVGKAKSLKNRVSSYFVKSNQHDRKTLRMVSQIVNFEFTIVNTEYDALLLENNLIKQYQPKYNILLRDDKTYPYICITKEPFPKLIATRKLERELGTFYGPYASVRAMHTLVELLRKLYTIRTCNLQLTEKNIEAKKFKVCLEYHIGNCKGPCEGLFSAQEHDQNIQHIRYILKGNIAPALQYFRQQMQEAAADLAFEKAQEFKEKMELLENFQSKSLVVNPNLSDVDVLALLSDEECAYASYLRIVNGSIIQAKTVDVKKKLDETDNDILTLLLVSFRSEFDSHSKEVVTNIPLSTTLEGITQTIPQIGDKKKLLELALKNVLYHKKEQTEKRGQQEQANKERGNRVLLKLQQDLQLKTIPLHIECFDNSNLQGTNPVSSMVYFRNGVAAKRDYRHFNVKTVEGPNDFASMHEVVFRRYKRVLDEKGELPDLIIIDGGKGQLSAACDALKELSLYGEIPIVGIAKRLEEIYFPEDSLPLYIDKKSESLRLIQRIRDEAHRFAITFHRDQRSKNSLNSQLETIPGIGKGTTEKLLKTYKSVKKIKEADLAELAKLIGQQKASAVKNHLTK